MHPPKMKKHVLIGILIFVIHIGYSQTAETLYLQGKKYMDQKDHVRATPLLQKAADMGNAEAQYIIGFEYYRYFQKQLQLKRNDSLSLSYLNKSAKQGNADAQQLLVSHYAGNNTKNDALAFIWALECGRKGMDGCIAQLITCYESGAGVAANEDSAFAWRNRLVRLPYSEYDTQTDEENYNPILVNHIKYHAKPSLAEKLLDKSSRFYNPIEAYMWYIVFNEDRISLSIPLHYQKEVISKLQTLENSLTSSDRDKGTAAAESYLGRKLTNYQNRLTPHAVFPEINKKKQLYYAIAKYDAKYYDRALSAEINLIATFPKGTSVVVLKEKREYIFCVSNENPTMEGWCLKEHFLIH